MEKSPEENQLTAGQCLPSADLLEGWISDAPESIKWAYHNQATVNRAMKEASMRGMSENAMLWELAATQARLNQDLRHKLMKAAEQGFSL